MHYRLQLFFVLLYLVFVTGLSPKLDADGLSFNVTPMITDLSIEPGASQTGLTSVRDNNAVGSPPIRFKVSLRDWTLDQSGQPTFADPGTMPDSCAPWMTVTPSELSVSPGQDQLVRYTVTAPPGSQGSYHCIILLTSAPEPAIVHNTSVNVCGCIGNTVYVQVGPPVYRAKITSLAVTTKNVALTVENTGSSYVRLGGVVKIADSTGNVIQQIKIPGYVVLPGSNNLRIVTMDTLSDLPSGAYTATAILDYGGDALLGARIHVNIQ